MYVCRGEYVSVVDHLKFMAGIILYVCRRAPCIDVGENLVFVSMNILCVYRTESCICVGEHLIPVSERILYLFGENSVCVRVCRLASSIFACVLLCRGECVCVWEIILYVYRQASIICQ